MLHAVYMHAMNWMKIRLKNDFFQQKKKNAFLYLFALVTKH